MERTKDGYFVGSNFPSDAKLREAETTFDAKDEHNSANVRKKRWEKLMEENRGKIDVEAGKRFLADHVDARDGETVPSAHTLCGHVDLDNEGAPEWEWAASYPGGACQCKVVDSKLASGLTFWACMGHACGETFRAKSFLATHPEFEWQEPFLHDLPSRRWAKFSSRGEDPFCRIPLPQGSR
jgi:hypothetical protein